MPKVYIDSDEQYPVYFIHLDEGNYSLNGFDLRSDVDQETLDRWADARNTYYAVQNEMRALSDEKQNEYIAYYEEHQQEIEAKIVTDRLIEQAETNRVLEEMTSNTRRQFEQNIIEDLKRGK